jgi:hypothetical protein
MEIQWHTTGPGYSPVLLLLAQCSQEWHQCGVMCAVQHQPRHTSSFWSLQWWQVCWTWIQVYVLLLLLLLLNPVASACWTTFCPSLQLCSVVLWPQ